MNKVIRRMVKIDEEKCNGCGLCATACHEHAIVIEDGKARLIKDDYCDGLGDCLPACPEGAIGFEVREAAPYDEVAVQARIAAKAAAAQGEGESLACGCPGTMAKTITRESAPAAPAQAADVASALSQWPVQIKLVPENAPYFQGAKLLVAATCSAFAYGNFHADFIKDHVVLIGCPKLDGVDYSEKLTRILANNDIKEITLARMSVPCCGGLEVAVKKAIKDSGVVIPWSIKVIGTDGQLIG